MTEGLRSVPGGVSSVRAARYALAVLAFINLLNYLDRWVVAAVVESIKRSELHLSDTQLGFVGTGFIIVYTFTSPFFGTLGDRRARPPLIAIGVALWSIATALAGFARGFGTLFTARSAVGVGEAAYGTIAPALLADFFPLEKRGRVLAAFYAAIPVGSAAGYVLGGIVDQHFGWRAAFWIAGTPGLLLSAFVLAVKDPPRGLHDPAGMDAAPPQNWTIAYRDLFPQQDLHSLGLWVRRVHVRPRWSGVLDAGVSRACARNAAE